jgi:hypothetical protein
MLGDIQALADGSAKLLTAAIVDQARKHRQLSPDEVARIQSQRALNQPRG